ncbi:MAG: flavin reductase family protein [Alphaproteobacteria bacterium]|nr:flavin reductase family protein [Alphaproteobacteria bacterium]
MDFATADLSERDAYKLLGSLVIPRPIAFVSTHSADGMLNCAPFSFFNAVGYAPPVVALGLEQWDDGREKDTGLNIRRTGEFVVNLVDEPLAEKMNLAAIDFPPEIDEFAEVGLTPAPSTRVAPPGIAEAPVRLECVRSALVQVGSKHTVVLGEVVSFHVRDDLIDAQKLHVSEAWRPIGRLFGGSYSRLDNRFDLPRVALDDWKNRSQT